jgi:hypothetical protein
MFQFELVFGSVGDISKALWDGRVRLKGSGLQKPEPFIRETVIHWREVCQISLAISLSPLEILVGPESTIVAIRTHREFVKVFVVVGMNEDLPALEVSACFDDLLALRKDGVALCAIGEDGVALGRLHFIVVAAEAAGGVAMPDMRPSPKR